MPLRVPAVGPAHQPLQAPDLAVIDGNGEWGEVRKRFDVAREAISGRQARLQVFSDVKGDG